MKTSWRVGHRVRRKLQELSRRDKTIWKREVELVVVQSPKQTSTLTRCEADLRQTLLMLVLKQQRFSHRGKCHPKRDHQREDHHLETLIREITLIIKMNRPFNQRHLRLQIVSWETLWNPSPNNRMFDQIWNHAQTHSSSLKEFIPRQFHCKFLLKSPRTLL